MNEGGLGQCNRHREILIEVNSQVVRKACTQILTNVQDSLLGSMLSGVPVVPVLQLLIATFVLSKHHHHHTLEHKDKTKAA